MKCANEFSNTNTPSYLGTDRLFKLLDIPLSERDFAKKIKSCQR